MHDFDKGKTDTLSEEVRLAMLLGDISSFKDIMLNVINKYPNAYKEFSEKNLSGLMRLKDKLTVSDMDFIVIYTEMNFALILHLLDEVNEKAEIE